MSTTGDVLTTRSAQSGAQDSLVYGFELNGQPAQNAALRNGRVVIRPNGGATTFAADTRLTFGAGGIGSEDVERDTRERQVWRDYPIVNVGQSDLEGIPIKAQTPQTLLSVFSNDTAHIEPLPSGSLLGQRAACFGQTDVWNNEDGPWAIIPEACSATASATNFEALRAAFDVNMSAAIADRPLLLTFVPDQTGSDAETLRVVIHATGEDRRQIFAQDVTLTPGRRMVLGVSPLHQRDSGVSIMFRRRGFTTGSIDISSLGLFVVQ